MERLTTSQKHQYERFIYTDIAQQIIVKRALIISRTLFNFSNTTLILYADILLGTIQKYPSSTFDPIT